MKCPFWVDIKKLDYVRIHFRKEVFSYGFKSSKIAKTRKWNKIWNLPLLNIQNLLLKIKIHFFNARYQRIFIRREKNRTTITIDYSMLISIYYILKNNVNLMSYVLIFIINLMQKNKFIFKKLKELDWERAKETNTTKPLLLWYLFC